MKFIDICCGIGGFHQALSSVGDNECVFASDIDKECRETYFTNYGIMPHGDITKVPVEDIPAFDILCAGFPCQTFSTAGKRKGFADTRGTIFFNIIDIAVHHKPKYMILENVKGLLSHDKGNTFKTILSEIKRIGYKTYQNPIVLNPLMYNIPQNRERIFILCCRDDIELPERPVIDKVDKTKLTCLLSDVISGDISDDISADISDCQLSEKLKHTETIWSKFLKILHDNDIVILRGLIVSDEFDTDSNTTSSKWFDKHRAYLLLWLNESRADPLWKGTKRQMTWLVQGELKSSLKNYCWHWRTSGIRVTDLNYTWTLTTIDKSIYGPESRYLTPRESIRLQSFPESFKLHKKNNVAYKQIGNSVNVVCVQKAIEYLIRD